MSDRFTDQGTDDLEARLRASRPVPDEQVLERSLARAKATEPRRALSLVWTTGAPRSTGRKLIAAVAMSAAALTLAAGVLTSSGTIGTASPNAASFQYLNLCPGPHDNGPYPHDHGPYPHDPCFFADGDHDNGGGLNIPHD